MNEKYTYGYNLGWDVENEYINSVKNIMNDYNIQIEKIYGSEQEEVVENVVQPNIGMIWNNDITEEQIRQWYNEDYADNNTYISFERYKNDILEDIKRKNEEFNKQLVEESVVVNNGLILNSDEYFANLYYLIDIKQDTRISINKRKRELELLLSEKNIDLSYVSLQQTRTKIKYDGNGNVSNYDELKGLRDKYDEIFLEIRKIEHALQVLNEMYKLVEFTKEETDLMIRGLNPQQRRIYDEINKDPKHDMDQEPDVDQEPDMDQEPDVDQEPDMDQEFDGDTEIEQWTLDGIIKFVCGDNKFNDIQSSKYAASKIKVFSKPQKNNLGLGYKIVSIPRTVIGIIPKAAMKLYGMFISNKTKEIFKQMEERANSLTDEQVETLLNEYKGAIAQSKRLPKGFNNAVKPRVNLYVSKKVAIMNEQIKNNLDKINYCGKVINVLKEKLKEENSPEMKARINDLLTVAYSNANNSIKSLIVIQIDGANLQNGNGLHSFEEELKALDTKLNYVGGRFSKSREYDPTLWSKISGYSQKIEYSLDPREVVDSYFARENVYKENTLEKRSIFNLGSKVTSGKLDYRPFVESLDYGNDPFIRDLITSILVISSTASLVNNMVDSIKYNQMLEELTKHNAENKEIIEQIRSNGGTIEKGMISDIKQTEGSIENLGERGINDKYDWNLNSSSYKVEDLAHHTETANLSINNTQQIMDLANKYTNGSITYAEYLKGIQSIKEHTTEVYETYAQDLYSYIEQYASANPQFDYTAVLSAIKHAINNPGDSLELTNLMTDLYEKSLNITDLTSLDIIEKTLSEPNLVPDILTLTSVASKTSQEQMDSENKVGSNSKRVMEIRDMINDLKAMKNELTEEEVKELEDFLRR